ncbi:MAG: DNA-directed RNA polymerase [Candidatus Aenigmatarchaeota archaeon]
MSDKMFKILEVKDTVRVPPEKFSKDLEKGITESLREKYEGILNQDVGIVLNIEEVEETGEGKVIPEDGAVFYPAKFKMLVYEPTEGEVVLGEVVDITEFGTFLRMGPIDGLVHISQVMDDYVDYDEKNRNLVGKKENKMLKEGDLVRARVISISYSQENKVGLTMRQPGLGALHWLEEKDKQSEKEEKEENSEDSEE